MFYVYMLKSVKDKTTYIGCTGDLRKRFEEHNQGKTRSLKSKLPLQLVYYEAYLDKGVARKREIELKKNSFRKKELFKRLFLPPSSRG